MLPILNIRLPEGPGAMKKTNAKTFRRVRMDSGQHLRIRLAALVLGALAFLPIAARLLRLMVVDYGYYTAKALNNQTRSTPVLSERGTVYDRNMNILASTVGVENVYLDPHELKQSGADLLKLSAFLGKLLERIPSGFWSRAGIPASGISRWREALRGRQPMKSGRT